MGTLQQVIVGTSLVVLELEHIPVDLKVEHILVELVEHILAELVEHILAELVERKLVVEVELTVGKLGEHLGQVATMVS